MELMDLNEWKQFGEIFVSIFELLLILRNTQYDFWRSVNSIKKPLAELIPKWLLKPFVQNLKNINIQSIEMTRKHQTN